MDETQTKTILLEISSLLLRLTDLTAKLAGPVPELHQDVQKARQLAHSVRVMLGLPQTNQ